MGRTSWLAIIAVATALAALSVSRMQVYAVYANERDAVRTLRQLADRVDQGGGSLQDTTLEAAAGSDFDPSGNSHWSEGGNLLRRNGYLFGVAPDAEGRPILQAWPWRHSETGLAAYALEPSRQLVAHPNEAGQWSGPQARPAVETPGWLDVTGALSRY
ncbi:hypothetical protein [Engelhardtia mirabilis]|uniref:Uncharacterized protein n=1 Tax=Engelhardtia mirabilis TaxID=2528011 RepID=A0A518BKR9_9BACT|nr:hypothetical protein Pla133_26500 [Planctomycetes bacterium Pla133]QDV01888.1 hypothetical protein Pla86_26490 [Planctomycetes bacterium Pla86]